jgi:hypothetical protein
MSNGFAIAAITAVLKNLLEDGLAQNSALSNLGNILVTTLPPDQISIGVEGQPQLNLFLYQITQNRHADWLSRDRNSASHAQGSISTDEKIALAIDLHYLLTVYGLKDFQTELLLGYSLQLMHQTPILSKDRIRSVLNHIAFINRTSLFAQAIESSIDQLTQQLGQVQVTPNLFDTDQMSRLWSLLHSPYRPSIAYEVSMILIGAESSLTETPSPPTAEHPCIDKIVSSNQGENVIIAGSRLILYGKNLSGEITRLCFRGEKNLIEPEIVEENRLLFKLPQTLQAGVQSVQVIHQPKYPLSRHQEVASNPHPFLLHPTIVASWQKQIHHAQQQPEQPSSTETSITVLFNPRIRPQQTVSLNLSPIQGTDGDRHTLKAPPRDTEVDQIQVSIDDIPMGIYAVQAEVDGVESPVNVDKVGHVVNLMTSH